MLIDFLGEQKLPLMEQAGYGAALVKKRDDLFSYGSIVAAEDRRTACLQEIVVLVAVKVIEERALSLCYADREGMYCFASVVIAFDFAHFVSK